MLTREQARDQLKTFETEGGRDRLVVEQIAGDEPGVVPAEPNRRNLHAPRAFRPGIAVDFDIEEKRPLGRGIDVTTVYLENASRLHGLPFEARGRTHVLKVFARSVGNNPTSVRDQAR